MLNAFHFQQPLWLTALVPLGLLAWWLKRHRHNDNAWQKIIDAPLQALLLTEASGKSQPALLWLLASGWLIATLALANPSWEYQPRPVFQTDTAQVIVLDLSRSMDITDLKPTRLARAKFKVEDILAQQKEGLMGLVVFAGDAFTVTPLTRDNDTLRALLDSLSTQIMPAQGSRADLGLLKAAELFKQAGLHQGQVLLIADGAERKTSVQAAKVLQKQGYTVSVLGVGTPIGGPIPNVRDAQNQPIVVPLQVSTLQQIAKAGGGIYRPLQSDDQDIQDLLTSGKTIQGKQARQSDDLQHQDWKSEGPILVLLLLPLAALAFRRGWLLTLGFVIIPLLQPDPLMASPLDKLWLRPDQQADQALREGNYEQAEQLAQDPLRKGSAAYKRGQFEQAVNEFSQLHNPDAHYNRGNALARLGQYEAAIKAYDEALKQQPDMSDALTNKAKVQALLDQQKQQKNQDNKNKDNNENKKQDGKNQENSSSSENQQKNDQQSGQKNTEPSKNADGQSGEAPQDKNSAADNHTSSSPKDQDSRQAEQKKPASDEKSNNGKEQKKDNQFANANQAMDKNKGQEQPDENEDAIKAPPQSSQPAPENTEPRGDPKRQQAIQEADTLNNEEKLAAEQWLNRIPDDPGGLMRRKFKYQYQQRRQPAGISNQTPW
ncbi:MAG TPA: VWA domain-containing protein [Gammaproteobacteria bacterium]|nr:VWA domain-containing protein [Gammaproteobacteria bacterium]